jgi:hypothetical protein
MLYVLTILCSQGEWQDLHDDDKMTCMQSSYWELILENAQGIIHTSSIGNCSCFEDCIIKFLPHEVINIKTLLALVTFVSQALNFIRLIKIWWQSQTICFSVRTNLNSTKTWAQVTVTSINEWLYAFNPVLTSSSFLICSSYLILQKVLIYGKALMHLSHLGWWLPPSLI